MLRTAANRFPWCWIFRCRGKAYVEDCEVCCNPIEVSYRLEDEELVSFAAKVLE